MYLLDANCLIDASRDYYRVGMVDEFWEWLLHKGEQGVIKIPPEILGEINEGQHALPSWARDSETIAKLELQEDVDPDLVQKVIEDAYVKDPTTKQLEHISRDPFIIAHALQDPTSRIVVTTEASKPTERGSKTHLPEACDEFGIKCIHAFTCYKDAEFSTNTDHW